VNSSNRTIGLLAVLGFVLAFHQVARAACQPWWSGAQLAVEQHPPDRRASLHLQALSSPGMGPHSPRVERAGGHLSVTYQVATFGAPSDIVEWSDTVDLGVLPSGSYDVTVRFACPETLELIEFGRTEFALAASDVPALDRTALGLLGALLGITGYVLLLRSRRG
jgi:hypothetical protein